MGHAKPALFRRGRQCGRRSGRDIPLYLYDNITKAEATALFLLRSEVLGLNCWLASVGVQGVLPHYVCGWRAQTVKPHTLRPLQLPGLSQPHGHRRPPSNAVTPRKGEGSSAVANKPGGHKPISCGERNKNRRGRRVYPTLETGGVGVKRSQQQVAPVYTTDTSVEGRDHIIAAGRRDRDRQ